MENSPVLGTFKYSQTSSYVHLRSCPFHPTSVANPVVTEDLLPFVYAQERGIAAHACAQRRLSPRPISTSERPPEQTVVMSRGSTVCVYTWGLFK